MTSPAPADQQAGDAADDLYEGAGIFSSFHDVQSAAGEQDAAGVGAAAVGAGLDSLGLVADPLGTLAEAGVGWAIEHISFLREPLDLLCGSPDEIKEIARSWHTLAGALSAQATGYGSSLAEVDAWTGAAAEAYRGAAGRLQEALGSNATNARGVAEVVLGSASMVGVERSLIRDAIATWVVRLAEWLIASVISAGLALAAAVPSMVVEATTMALHFVETITKLLDRLDEAGRVVGELAEGMAAVSNAVAHHGAALSDALEPGASLVGGAANLRGALEDLAGADVAPTLRAVDQAQGTDLAVEVGKESGKERAERASWDENGPPRR